MWFLQKWWPWPWSLSNFHQNNLPVSLELSTSAVKISERLNQWCGLYIVQLWTDRQTNKQTDRQTDRQTAVTNILCKNLRFCKVTNKQTNKHIRVSVRQRIGYVIHQSISLGYSGVLLRLVSLYMFLWYWDWTKWYYYCLHIHVGA